MKAIKILGFRNLIKEERKNMEDLFYVGMTEPINMNILDNFVLETKKKKRIAEDVFLKWVEYKYKEVGFQIEFDSSNIYRATVTLGDGTKTIYRFQHQVTEKKNTREIHQVRLKFAECDAYLIILIQEVDKKTCKFVMIKTDEKFKEKNDGVTLSFERFYRENADADHSSFIVERGEFTL